jgi:hypothetical protein
MCSVCPAAIAQRKAATRRRQREVPEAEDLSRHCCSYEIGRTTIKAVEPELELDPPPQHSRGR